MSKDFQSVIDTALKHMPRPTGGSRPDDYPMAIHSLPYHEESQQPEMLHRLEQRQRPLPGKHVHVGVAGFFNLDLATRTHPDAMLLLDVNEDQACFWKEIVTLLKEQPTAEGFIKAFLERCDKPGFCYHNFATAEKIVAMINSGFSHQSYFENKTPHWLKDPEAYAFIRSLACEGKIAAATLDLTKDTERARALGGAMRAENLTTDTCYWSNIILSIQQGTIAAKEPDAAIENMLNIVSRIGGDQGTHIMVGNHTLPLVMTEGPPRDPGAFSVRYPVENRAKT